MPSKRRVTASCAADGSVLSVPRFAWAPLGRLLAPCLPPISPGTETRLRPLVRQRPAHLEEQSGKGNRHALCLPLGAVVHPFPKWRQSNAQASHPTCAQRCNPASANDSPSSFRRRMNAARRGASRRKSSSRVSTWPRRWATQWQAQRRLMTWHTPRRCHFPAGDHNRSRHWLTSAWIARNL